MNNNEVNNNGINSFNSSPNMMPNNNPNMVNNPGMMPNTNPNMVNNPGMMPNTNPVDQYDINNDPNLMLNTEPVDQYNVNNNPNMINNMPQTDTNTKFTAMEQPNLETNTIDQTNMNNNSYEEKKKKSFAPVIVVILLLVILGAGGFYGYQMFFSKPYQKVVESAFAKIKTSNILKGSYKVTGDLSFSSDNALNGMKFDFSVSVDQANRKELLSMGYSESDKKIMSDDVYIDNDKVYVNLNNMYDKVLVYDIKDVLGVQPKLDPSETNYLIDVSEKMFMESLKDVKPTRNSTTVKINNNDVKLTAITYTINKDNYAKIANNMLDVLRNDKKAINILAKLVGVSETDFKEKVLTVFEPSEFGSNTDLIIYTKGLLNNFAGVGIKKDNSKIDYYTNDGYNCFIVNNPDNNSVITIEGPGENLNIKYLIGENIFLTGTISKQSDNYSISISIPEIMSFKLNYKFSSLTSIEPFDTSNTVNINDLTPEEKQKIAANVEKALENSQLLKYLGSTKEILQESADKTANYDY